MSYWKLDEALQLVRAIQPEVKKHGYHVTLGGGVLNKGRSEKDLDLYCITLDNPKFKTSYKGLVEYLKGMWGYCDLIGDEYGEPKQDLFALDRNDGGMIDGPPRIRNDNAARVGGPIDRQGGVGRYGGQPATQAFPTAQTEPVYPNAAEMRARFIRDVERYIRDPLDRARRIREYDVNHGITAAPLPQPGPAFVTRGAVATNAVEQAYRRVEEELLGHNNILRTAIPGNWAEAAVAAANQVPEYRVGPNDGLDMEYFEEGDLSDSRSPFTAKLKFMRNGNDRIDVFVIGS